MKISNILTSLSKMTGRTGLLIQAKSPEILLVIGITGAVASTVLACRATLKVETVLDNHMETRNKIDHCWDKVKEGEVSLDEYSDMDHKKDLVIAYTHTGLDFVKLYGPAVTLGVISLACIVGSHGIMKQRNVALMAAYQAVEKGFAAYRKRVVEEFGEEKDYMYKNGLRSETVIEEEVGENGKVKKVKKEKLVVDPNGFSMYARFFDESCSEWSKDPEYNLFFLKAQQNIFNDLLKVRGHVFLNEVYDALGIKRSRAGAVVGWVIRPGHDNFVDFGIFDGDREKVRDFVNGKERSILLDFNVDGVIYDLFTKETD